MCRVYPIESAPSQHTGASAGEGEVNITSCKLSGPERRVADGMRGRFYQIWSALMPTSQDSRYPCIHVALCLAWTVWLLLLNIAPNSMANRIMNTSRFESGSFWLFIDPPLPIFRLAIFGLTCVSVGYALILIKLVMKRAYSARVSPENKAVEKMTALSTGVIGAIKSIFTNAIPRRHLSSAASLVDSLTTDESIRRKRLVCKRSTCFFSASSMFKLTRMRNSRQNLFMKFVDLFIQTVMLLQILENGVPIVLVAVVTVIVAANAVGCALVMLLPFEQTALVENVVDLMYVRPYLNNVNPKKTNVMCCALDSTY
ncbi:hypothetical protein GQ600_10247 [Phytophthora cactorum]|nr:hypothetical protein GQ600_10247 [Phytophthora cactorum]